jgi:zinc/manganese transport system ATP-binding protein
MLILPSLSNLSQFSCIRIYCNKVALLLQRPACQTATRHKDPVTHVHTHQNFHPLAPQCPELAGLAADAGRAAACAAALAGGGLGSDGGRPMVATDAVVSLHNLTVSYRQHPALHHISGHFAPGSLTAVVGPNGSGKSTLLKSIVGLLPIEAGGNLTVTPPRERIAYLPQVAEIDRSFPIDVRDCVLLGCWGLVGAWGGVSSAMLAKVDAALEAVGLRGFERRGIGSLSSGQLQRVMFARMLVQDAELILLDEPFNAIDAKTAAALMKLVCQWHQQQRTVVAVLHDDSLVRQHFPSTVLLARELVGWGATSQVLTEPNLRQARAMAEAWDEVADRCDVDTLAEQKMAA